MSTDRSTCPACGASGLEPFHEQDGVPVHSCRLLATRREALEFPRGSLRLAVCASCGFVTNTAYDPRVQDYGEQYEETQGFSPRFRTFAEELARGLVERHGVRGRHVLEIGCGKGEFLALLCELGDNRGTGIDPSFVPERFDSRLGDRVTVIRDYYSPRYGHLAGDLVVCRHTLEHIDRVADFVGMVRASLDESADAVVFFEVPDTMRVLREPAFWDIYYEHCSYFTAGSLARLFRGCGFEVLDVSLAFDNQYLLLDARPSPPPGQAPGQSPQEHSVGEPPPVWLPDEEPASETLAAARSFPARFAAARSRWRGVLDAAASGRVALWGSGSKAVSFLTTLGVGDEVGCVVDLNPYKHGRHMAGTGHEIVAPEALRSYRPDLVIAMNGIYRKEIEASLRELGIECALVTLDDPATAASPAPTVVDSGG